MELNWIKGPPAGVAQNCWVCGNPQGGAAAGGRGRNPLRGHLPDVLRGTRVFTPGDGTSSTWGPRAQMQTHCRVTEKPAAGWGGDTCKVQLPKAGDKALPKPKPVPGQSSPADPALGPAGSYRPQGRCWEMRSAAPPPTAPALAQDTDSVQGSHATTTTATASARPAGTLAFWGCSGPAASGGSIPRAAGRWSPPAGCAAFSFLPSAFSPSDSGVAHRPHKI